MSTSRRRTGFFDIGKKRVSGLEFLGEEPLAIRYTPFFVDFFLFLLQHFFLF